MAHARMRPFGDVISLEAARAILDSTGTPIANVETIMLSEANGRVLAQRRRLATRRPAVFSRGHGWLCRAGARYAGRVAIGSADADESRNALHRRGVADIGTRWPVRRNLHRRTDTRWRRRGGDGRRDRLRCRQRRADFRRGAAAAERRAPGRRHSSGPGRRRGRRRGELEPHRRAGRRRIRLGRRVRSAARRDSFDRQRSDRSGARAEAGTDLRHQPFHALGRRLGQRRHSDRVPARSRHARRARRGARRSASTTTSWSFRAEALSASAI